MKLNKKARTVSQVSFLLIFIFLLIKGKNQLWMVIFGLGVLVSAFAGRFYCGWVCQIGTILRAQNYIKKKLKLPEFKLPKVFNKSWIRYIFLLLFLAFIVVMQKQGKQPGAVLIISAIAFVTGIFFNESLWHNVFCPYGTILSVSSRLSKKNVKIDEEKCIACGKCERVCPSQTINKAENQKRRIFSANCLVCGQCMDACPVQVIDYKS